MISFAKNLSTKFNFLVNKSQTFNILRQTPCHLCDEITLTESKICNECSQDLQWNTHHCQQCAYPLHFQNNEQNDSEILCGECLSSPPPFTTSIIPFTYSFPINSIIRRIKYNREQYWLKPLSQLFKEYLYSYHENYALPDLLIAVPMHRSKLKKRGFNQAEIFAKQLSVHLSIPNNTKVLYKFKESSDQASLNKVQRLKNLKNCFRVRSAEKIAGKHIALCDDVMTSKATSEICSQILLRNGAARVDVWCLARTPKNNQDC